MIVLTGVHKFLEGFFLLQVKVPMLFRDGVDDFITVKAKETDGLAVFDAQLVNFEVITGVDFYDECLFAVDKFVFNVGVDDNSF